MGCDQGSDRCFGHLDDPQDRFIHLGAISMDARGVPGRLRDATIEEVLGFQPQMP